MQKIVRIHPTKDIDPLLNQPAASGIDSIAVAPIRPPENMIDAIFHSAE